MLNDDDFANREVLTVCLRVVLTNGPLKKACAALLQETDPLMTLTCGLLAVNPGCMRLHRIASKFLH